MTNNDKVTCNFCEGGKRVIDLTESSTHFLSNRITDGTIDEAITISRIAWESITIHNDLT